jgi:hypothetical protein
MTTTASNMLPGLAAQICPVAPPGAQQYADQLMGYLLWGVGLLFILGVVVGIGAIVGDARSPCRASGVRVGMSWCSRHHVLPGIVRRDRPVRR